MVSSMTSRVVPCMSLTMARSSCSNWLSRVDLPTFGAPMMATGMPFLTALPVAKESTRRVISFSTSVAMSMSFWRSANSTSSSLKSSSSSSREVSSSNCVRSSARRLLKPPRIWFIATRCMAVFCDAIRSATASAWLRSILPLRKARWVNSPGLASVQPLAMRSSHNR